MQKLLILDGIGGVPLGREIYEAFCEDDVKASYCDLAQLKKIHFYGLRSALAKLINRAERLDDFFHLPKLDLKRFIDLLEKERPTHILVVGFVYKLIAPSVLKRLKQDYNFSLYLYDTDSCNLYAKRREFIFFLDQELPVYDKIFSFSKVTTQFFERTRNLNAIHLPFGAKPIPPQYSDKKHNVLFVGSGDLRRIFLLENIRDEVVVYGNRWERNFPLISQGLQSHIVDQSTWGGDLYRLLRASKIVLNITRTHFYGAETGVNLRIFEALASGAFLLTDYCEEIAELFEIGVEIETFNNASELKQKVNYYLANPEAREAIARRGYEKFMSHHTWKERVTRLREHIAI